MEKWYLAQIGRSNLTPRILTLKHTQFLWGILSLIILSNGSIAQQAAAEDEEEYSEDEYEEYEEYDYGGCSKLSKRKKSLETLKTFNPMPYSQMLASPECQIEPRLLLNDN